MIQIEVLHALLVLGVLWATSCIIGSLFFVALAMACSQKD